MTDTAYYLTPDSRYYLQAAQNLLDGRGYRIDFQNKDTFCAIWPVGYSLLIAGVSFLTKLSVELSSKVVNLLAVAGILLLIYRQYKIQSWFVALALLSSSFLQLYANTWSETVFVFCMLGFCFNYNQKNNSNWAFAVAAFLTRYIGFFLIVPLIVQRKYKVAFVFGVFIGLYLLNNYAQNQTFTGDHGHFPTEPFATRLIRGLEGIGQEIAFWGVRDWDLKSGSEVLIFFIYGISTLQATILVVTVKIIIDNKTTVVLSPISSGIFVVAGSYLLTTILLYLFDDSIESLYFRRLSPATFLVLIGGLGWLTEQPQRQIFDRVKWWVVAFFTLSVVHALPKMAIFEFLNK